MGVAPQMLAVLTFASTGGDEGVASLPVTVTCSTKDRRVTVGVAIDSDTTSLQEDRKHKERPHGIHPGKFSTMGLVRIFSERCLRMRAVGTA